MKKIHHLLFFWVSCLFIIACSRPESDVIPEDNIQKESVCISAGWGDAETTRTEIHNETEVWWSDSHDGFYERITVFRDMAASGVLESRGGSKKAVFNGYLIRYPGQNEGPTPSSIYCAVYPADDDNQFDGVQATLRVHNEQAAVRGSFEIGGFPSIGWTRDLHEFLQFYNICGGCRFRVVHDDIVSVTFRSVGGEPLSGRVRVKQDDNGRPVVSEFLEPIDSVMLYAPEGFTPNENYYVSLLPQTLQSGLKITLRRNNGLSRELLLGGMIPIRRAHFGILDYLDTTWDYSEDQPPVHDPAERIIFQNEKVERKLVQAFDTNLDGVLSYGEAAAVTSLEGVSFHEFNYYGNSFNELQYFTGVTALPDKFCLGWYDLQEIVLPPHLVSIGKDALYATNLKQLVIPSSVTEIGSGAFRSCCAMLSITLSNRLISIPEDAFYSCSRLQSIYIPASVKEIGPSAFRCCNGLKSIELPAGVQTIKAYAFADCTALSSISIPDSVTEIGDWAFLNCGFKSVIFPETLKRIGKYAFSGCPLTELNLPSSLQSMGEGAFYETDIASVVIPPSISVLEDYLFFKCQNLSSVSLPPTLTRIEDNVFIRCAFRAIDLPDSIESIGDSAFAGCDNLESITIPSKVDTLIETFSGCSNLQLVHLPEGLKVIGYMTFYGCKKMPSISLPSTLEVIGSYAFNNSIISSFELPSSLKTIEDYAFIGCNNLVSLTIPSSVESVDCLFIRDCRNLRELLFECDIPPLVKKYPTIPPSWPQQLFIYVPDASLSLYKSSDCLADYKNLIFPLSQYPVQIDE